MKRRKKITQLDLFSGIGGFHMGLERAGYKVKSYFSEVDKHAIAVYKNQFKDAEYVGSVTDIKGEELPNIDIITFGSPCQDFSLAGKRKGMGGDRSSLITEAIRLIHECRPRVFIWENVKGTFSSNSGEDFAAIIQAFANIGGYTIEWQLLNTSWFPNTPQNRERIYLVGYSAKTKRNWRGVFPISESTRQAHVLQRQQANICTLTTRYGADGNGSYITERKLDAQEVTVIDKKGHERKDGNASTIVAQYHKHPTDSDYLVVKSANKQGYEIAEEGDAVRLSQPDSKTQRGRVGKGVAHTLVTSGQQGVVANYTYKKVNETIEQNREQLEQSAEPVMMDLHNRSLRDESPCLVEPHHNNSAVFDNRYKQLSITDEDQQILGYTRDTKGNITDRHLKDTAALTSDVTMNMVQEPSYRIRRLTPIECERLQGFPDNHTQYGEYDGEVKLVSNTQRYKMCGNAVTVDVVEAVATQIKDVL